MLPGSSKSWPPWKKDKVLLFPSIGTSTTKPQWFYVTAALLFGTRRPMPKRALAIVFRAKMRASWLGELSLADNQFLYLQLPATGKGQIVHPCRHIHLKGLLVSTGTLALLEQLAHQLAIGIKKL